MPENGRKKHIKFQKWHNFGHFAKAIAKPNSHKWSILRLSLKIPKHKKLYPLKSLELFYEENCSNTLNIEKCLDVEKWQNWPFCKAVVRQSGQKRFILSRNFREPKIYKK